MGPADADQDRVDDPEVLDDEGVAPGVEDERPSDGADAVDEPADSLRGLVLFLATNLVDDPEAVDVQIERHGNTVDLRLSVPEAELGRLIGRQGRIARALRTALMVAASRHHLRVSLDIEPS